VAGNTKFKFYKNKNSLAKRRTRMLDGGKAELKGNKIGWWEKRELPKNSVTDRIEKITEKYHKRPELMAKDFLGSTRLMWLLLQYNNIVDIEEEFVLGKEIILPSRGRAETEFTGKSPKKNID
jgi:hypothetical protein